MEKEEEPRDPRLSEAAKEVFKALIKIGVSPKAVGFISSDTDWALVIKLHAILDGFITQLIVASLGKDELASVISRLELGDRKRGKLAFVKALDLLKDEEINFLRVLSELRNLFAHKIEHLETNLKSHFDQAPPREKKSFEEAIRRVGNQNEGVVFEDPRQSLAFSACMVILRIHFRLLEIERARQAPSPKES